MEIVIIIVLGVIIAEMWRRLRALENRLGKLEAQPATISQPSILQPAAISQPQKSEALKTQGPTTQPSTSQAVAELPTEKISSAPEPQPSEVVLAEADESAKPDTDSRFQFDFEDIFGRKLPIWAGGITLAVAGLFLVRYSIESGLLTPVVRVAMAFVFGLLLLAGAEWAYRNEQKVADERVRQSLAGAGLATLYAAFYLSGSQYGLVGQSAAFGGLAFVTAIAIALSFRFGLPCAILALVGGFAAPVLVGGDDANLPMLSLYLGLVAAGLTLAAKRQARPWLSVAALVFGLGWGAFLLLADGPGVAEILALGLYFIVLGAVLPAFAAGEGFERPLRLGSAFVASVQLALLVDQGGYAPLAWGLYLLLGATLAYFAWSTRALRETSAVAAIVSVMLLAMWQTSDAILFAIVAGGITLVYAGVALAHVWRMSSTRIDSATLAVLPLALGAITYGTFADFWIDQPEPVMALGLLVLAALPILGAWRTWRSHEKVLLAALIASGGILVFGAGLLITPVAIAVVVGATVFAALFALLHERAEPAAQTVLWGFASATLFALFTAFPIIDEVPRLFGQPETTSIPMAIIRWVAATAPWVALAWSSSSTKSRGIAEAVAATVAYGIVAQFVPADLLAWATALGAVALWFVCRPRTAAHATLLVIAAAWAALPLAEWTNAGLSALLGEPMFVSDVAGLPMIALRLAPLAVALGVIGLPVSDRIRAKFNTRLPALLLTIVVAHSVFKYVFAIDSVAQLAATGMAERTIWQGLLLGVAAAVSRDWGAFPRQTQTALVLATVALAHALWFTGVLYNPLWYAQAVGPTPIANLVLLAGAIATGLCLVIRPHLTGIAKAGLDGLIMLVAGFTALALLRQLFSGSILTAVPMTATEDLLRSFTGIVLAIAFLLIGRWREERSWRIGSLVFILIAVAKVFIVDAADLEGLLRVASFMALGFSLIGIGWLYARQFKISPAQPEE